MSLREAFFVGCGLTFIAVVLVPLGWGFACWAVETIGRFWGFQ